MITAVDTNIFFDLLLPDPLFYQSSSDHLKASSEQGTVVICDIVYTELCAYFSSKAPCNALLQDLNIKKEALSEDASFLASRAWLSYRRDGGSRVRILPDFSIGAHASIQATRLLTRDIKFYQSRFPNLTLVDYFSAPPTPPPGPHAKVPS